MKSTSSQYPPRSNPLPALDRRRLGQVRELCAEACRPQLLQLVDLAQQRIDANPRIWSRADRIEVSHVLFVRMSILLYI